MSKRKTELHHASMLDYLATYDGPLFDSCVTDPPYHLASIVARFGKEGSAPCKEGATGAYARASRGFMGKEWDGGDIAFRPETWRAVYDALKPGAHLVAFSGTRTYHRMACAIEDAGFEIRDQLAWMYGSGFPKSHSMRDIGKPEWGTAIKPAWEPICLARKPLSEKTVAANVLKHGTGAINIDACRVGTDEDTRRNALGGENGLNGSSTFKIRDRRADEMPRQSGRFPANVIHDGSDEVIAEFPETSSGGFPANHGVKDSGILGDFAGAATGREGNCKGQGSAARFFYSAKAGPLDRLGSQHATIKPVDLMRWLCRLVTPTGGHILEPFAGSGTTGIAAMVEGFDCTMIEMEADHVADIERKLAHLRGEGVSSIEMHKKRKAQPIETIGGLFD
jgi:site-specific DNA-methyltransferase (adenine-specific)